MPVSVLLTRVSALLCCGPSPGAGKLPLRQRTHLRAKLHRHLARQVKIARIMAILPTTEQWKPSHGAPVSQQKSRHSHQQRRH